MFVVERTHHASVYRGAAIFSLDIEISLASGALSSALVRCSLFYLHLSFLRCLCGLITLLQTHSYSCTSLSPLLCWFIVAPTPPQSRVSPAPPQSHAAATPAFMLTLCRTRLPPVLATRIYTCIYLDLPSCCRLDYFLHLPPH